MPVTLAQAALNTQDDVDVAAIDEFRKSSAILDALPFHQAVNPAGGGSTLTHGYTRVVTQAGAALRAINTEYTPGEAAKQRYNVDLKPVGGSFQIDRVLAATARGTEVAFQMSQKVKATTTRFVDEVINGDVAVDEDGWDGLDAALTGSSTEVNANLVTDWTDIDDAGYHAALDVLDDFLSYLDGEPTMLIGHRRVISKIRALGRRANEYRVNPVEGLLNATGEPITRQFYGNVLLVDPGTKSGSAADIIPVETRDLASDSPDAGDITGLTDLYAVRIGMDGFHGVAVTGQPLVQTWLPDFTTAGAVKTGEVEMGPVASVLKATKAAAVLRNIKVN